MALTSVLLASLRLVKDFKKSILSEAKMQKGGALYVYRMKVIETMKKHQNTFNSEFSDDYNSAKASIGSVIINIEKSWTK